MYVTPCVRKFPQAYKKTKKKKNKKKKKAIFMFRAAPSIIGFF